MRHRRHTRAGLGAAAASLGTVQHLGIARCHTAAVVGTIITGFGTYAAGISMNSRLKQHQARTGLAQFGAFQQHGNMILRGVNTTAI